MSNFEKFKEVWTVYTAAMCGDDPMALLRCIAPTFQCLFVLEGADAVKAFELMLGTAETLRDQLSPEVFEGFKRNVELAIEQTTLVPAPVAWA